VLAAGTPQYGSVKLNWTVNTTATLALVTNYPTAATFTQQTTAPVLGANPAGSCGGSGAPASETAFNVSFGALNPSLTVPVSCLYENAVAVSVTTNDAAGFTVKEYLDSAPPTGVGLCAFTNGAGGTLATTTRTAAFPNAATYAGNNLSACAAGGTQVPVGTGGSSTGGTTPGNPNTAGLEYYQSATNGFTLVNSAAAATTAYLQGEDLQLNLAPGTASTTSAQSVYMTVVLTPN
jgi:hypothetical protein